MISPIYHILLASSCIPYCGPWRWPWGQSHMAAKQGSWHLATLGAETGKAPEEMGRQGLAGGHPGEVFHETSRLMSKNSRLKLCMRFLKNAIFGSWHWKRLGMIGGILRFQRFLRCPQFGHCLAQENTFQAPDDSLCANFHMRLGTVCDHRHTEEMLHQC